MTDLRRTALHDVHVRLGGRMVPFAGYAMPVQYAGVLEEHEAVRQRAGLFDVSHMSNLWVTGPAAPATLSRAFTAEASRIPPGGTKYTVALRADGTILDDLYVFHLPRGFHVIPNAGQNEPVAEHLRASGAAKVEDVTASTAILALQGPLAQDILEKALGRPFGELKRFHLTQAPELGQDAFISRTGYTGEDGFELVFPAAQAVDTWERILDAGGPRGMLPCGLGARDTLRLEKGYCLAGNEFAGGRTPLEAGLSWLLQWDHDFVGKPVLERQRAEGPALRLVALRMAEKGIPRHGHTLHADGREVGVVTSGTMSPVLKEGIALGYVEKALAQPGTRLQVDVRGRPVAAVVVKLPFV